MICVDSRGWEADRGPGEGDPGREVWPVLVRAQGLIGDREGKLIPRPASCSVLQCLIALGT